MIRTLLALALSFSAADAAAPVPKPPDDPKAKEIQALRRTVEARKKALKGDEAEKMSIELKQASRMARVQMNLRKIESRMARVLQHENVYAAADQVGEVPAKLERTRKLRRSLEKERGTLREIIEGYPLAFEKNPHLRDLYKLALDDLERSE